MARASNLVKISPAFFLLCVEVFHLLILGPDQLVDRLKEGITVLAEALDHVIFVLCSWFVSIVVFRIFTKASSCL